MVAETADPVAATAPADIRDRISAILASRAARLHVVPPGLISATGWHAEVCHA